MKRPVSVYEIASQWGGGPCVMGSDKLHEWPRIEHGAICSLCGRQLELPVASDSQGDALRDAKPEATK